MNLINFFTSFDKLMKEKLVQAFYWLALIMIAMAFSAEALANLKLGPLAKVINFFEFFVRILFAVVSLRLFCEGMIALFRINDNLSPDGGKSETADIDPIEEARRAAEEAAKRAREMTNKAVDKTKSAASNLKDKAEGAADKAEDIVEEVADNAEDAVEEAAEKVKTAAKKIASPAKKKTTTRKKAPTKKTAAKKTTKKKS